MNRGDRRGPADVIGVSRDRSAGLPGGVVPWVQSVYESRALRPESANSSDDIPRTGLLAHLMWHRLGHEASEGGIRPTGRSA